MQTSEYFNLKLADGTDTVNPLTIDRPNYETIDEVMHNNAISSVGVATELANGTVHALTRVNPETPVFRFIATADANAGDTYTVDGVQVTALLSNGTPLSDGSYVINANVLCALSGTLLTFFVSSSNSVAKDAEKLGGLEPEAYAKTDIVAGIATTATNASDMALTNKNALSGIKFGIDDNGNYGYYKVGADTVSPFKTKPDSLTILSGNITTTNSNLFYNTLGYTKMDITANLNLSVSIRGRGTYTQNTLDIDISNLTNIIIDTPIGTGLNIVLHD